MIHQQLICEVSSTSVINSFSNSSCKSLIISDSEEYLELKFNTDSLQKLAEIISYLSRLHQLLQEEKKQEMMTQLKSLNLAFSLPNFSDIHQENSQTELPF
ncbi:hypothetical protein [Planktothrix sp. FACHB-1365]|uniref:hypothetical protein n=1 Tax=Planktothrix sp. FACHB-1365 TaxID=2692855 RepID=UPI001682DAC1|nr:hypothetical protein [Planktothrix sp. FACHB-1365]MBD2485611.1 hypothetical protein [Planktothrix sp. FACHB-1365]